MPTLLLCLLIAASGEVRPTIAIAPPVSSAPQDAWVGLALADTLGTRLLIHSRYDAKSLERIYPLNVFGWRQTLAAARGEGIDAARIDDTSAVVVARQLGADAVFVGSYVVTGKDVALRWALVGDRAKAGTLALTLDGIGPAAEALAAAILQAIGQDARTAGGNKIEPLPIAAYKPFGEALLLLGRQSLDPRAQLVLGEPELRRAVALLSAATDAGPSFVRAWVERGIAAAMLGDEKGAEEALVQAMAQAGEFDPPTALGLYYLYDRQHKYDEAIAILRQATDAHLGFLQGLGYLGEAYARAGMQHESALVFTNYSARVPKSPWAALRRGAALARLGKHDAAIADTEALLVRFPGSLAVLTALASRQIDAGQLDLARATLQKVLSQKPDLPAALTRLSYIELEQNKAAIGLTLAERAVKALGDGRGEPLAGYAHLNLGHALALLGRKDEAMAAFAKAATLGVGSEEMAYVLRDARLADILADPRFPLALGHKR